LIVAKNRLLLTAVYVCDDFGSQSAASNAAALVIGHCPSREYLIQICAVKGCKSPLVVKFADTQREKELKRLQAERLTHQNSSLGLLGMQAATVCRHNIVI